VSGGRFPAGAALVVGGSGGIGAEVCSALAERGSDVVLTYRSNAAKAADAVAAVEAAGARALALPLDLGDPTACEAVCARAAEELGGVHTLVFAVGADISMVRAAEVDPEEWRRTIDSDLTGFFTIAKAALPYLRTSGGSIVALSSAGVVRHPPLDVLSTVPKAGIEALVRAIAREEGRNGVRANSVALGVVDGGQFHRAAEHLPADFIAAITRNTAVRRLGTLREAADAVVFLASPEAAYITGHRLVVDGGYSV
jgi:3-oxoacyl-[acyl-carrier protein] reductase